MHESGLLQDLMTRAETELAESGAILTGLTFRVGALSGVDPGWLGAAARHYAMERWGLSPLVEVEQAADPTDPGAFGVALVSIRVGA